VQSQAKTVAQYLKELPEDRRTTVEAVRKTILDNLDADYEEGMQYGMIGYYVPHRVFPPGYHCNPKQPLPFACLASQKNHLSLYLMSCYGEGVESASFRTAWAKTGKKLDMGKSCIRFKSLDDLALEVIGDAIREMPATKYIARYEAFLEKYAPRTAKKAAAKNPATRAKPAARAKSAARSKPKKAVRKTPRAAARKRKPA
jgi:Domain of unknown function (DU1801)